ncbi:peptidylprolyl isomerase [Nonomuraea africana]|uniref:Peptidyl-prolyl cis-trans isomerase B (Cyclophilin B) n=1 Tax=Nonomuraea africana TaxID=46171 RepID=A0ABR9KH58_9ACTN|nr:peptidylprolyl isomerase [Nonomuraea africana]MBE1560907.1 peptidyl-prolyl cis-trans isomerase B (cyclophilin B) [Nonomuraea africana]
MSGDDRQSQLAREHKERQAQRAAEQAAKAKRNTFIGAGVAVALVAGGIIAATTMLGRSDATPMAAEETPSASPSASTSVPAVPSASPSVSAGPVSCTYKKETNAGVPTKYVGMPGKKPNKKLKQMTILTNHGKIVIDLMTDQAPCSVNAMDFLAKKNFFDNTKCQRLVTPDVSGLHLLQCGDPLAKADGVNPTDGQGSAGFTYGDENIGMPYSQGVVFITQPSGSAGQNGSQFAISLSNDNTQLPAEYSVLGVVSEGMEMMLGIAKDEKDLIVNPNDVTGDGGTTAPKKPVIIKDVRLS